MLGPVTRKLQKVHIRASAGRSDLDDLVSHLRDYAETNGFRVSDCDTWHRGDRGPIWECSIWLVEAMD